MAKIDIKSITDIIKEQIEQYKDEVSKENVGKIISIADGICQVYGLKKAMMGELILFKDGISGMVLNLEETHVGVVIFNGSELLKQNDTCKTTGKLFEIPVGEEMLGRVINPLGSPIDLNGGLITEQFRPIESEAYGVMQRDFVTEPLETGIKVIDALVPIGKGQRQLIIGDRQTGKSTIAIDTILNQKGKDVICIYVSIGQKESSVASTVELLNAKDALKYTIVISAGPALEATLLYLAPFSGITIAEYFLKQGKNILIVFDDLSKHADSYRQLSLLLKRPPGREAYPGDIFYLHSRLLERCAKVNSECLGGSITGLPIVETQNSDISAYIPTNIISITDGQIFLERDLFNRGIRPAINSGLSVSRVGGSAQWKAMRSVASTLRLELASYNELASFAQFGAELDEASRKRLQRGALIEELFKQDLHNVKSLTTQIIVLYALKNGMLDEFNINKLTAFETEVEQNLRIGDLGKQLNSYIHTNHSLPDDTLIIEKFIKDTMRFIE